MLVMRGLRNDQLELRERAAVQAFALGYATTEHYHILADMHSVMLLAGSIRKQIAGNLPTPQQ
jgi:regulator of RNase E activity RraB